MATMDPAPQRGYRGPRTNGHVEGGGSGRRAHHGNKRWVADGVAVRSGTATPHVPASDGERWERGGHKGDEKFWQELVKARETEREKAIAEGKMDDPLKPKRLEDAITMVGTCLDMCPRFERYRRERENNLFEWETIPGTKRVDHKRAVKAYERAAGDKTLPSDLRPPDVLKRTLDYLFHELLPRGGFSETFNFIRDRSRAVRTDFTMQHEMGPIAIKCHDRCARFHILALHIERDHPGFSIAMEEQQLMNTLQSLKEFYQDQRDHYQSPTELEMRVYHRLVHIRDQRERHDDIPQTLLDHPVFKLTTKFRARVQANSAPITKTSSLIVDVEAMQIFAELAGVLRREGNVVMTYLVACLLERHFGKDTIEDIESIRGDLSLSDIIDGYSGMGSQEQDTDIDISVVDETEAQAELPHSSHDTPPKPLQPSGTQWITDNFGPKPTQSAFKSASADPPSQPSVTSAQSAFSDLKAIPNVFGTASFGTQGVFSNAASAAPPISPFGTNNAPVSSSLPHEATANVSFPTSSISSFPSFSPAPAKVQTTTSKPRAHQSSKVATDLLFPLQPSQGIRSTFPAAQKKIFGSETSTSTLNPLAPNFTPTLNLAGASGITTSTPTSLSFGITPSTTVHSPNEKRKFNAFISTSNESLTPPPRQPTQEQSTSDVTALKIPIVSSPPSMDSAPLEGTISQIPPPRPPPLNRRPPISLPPTPTATMFIPPSSETRKSIFVSLKNIQTTPFSAAPTEILSPLVLHSPTSRSLSSMPSLLRRESVQSPLKTVVSAAGVEVKAEKVNTPLVSRPPPVKKPSLDIMKATALHFARRGWMVKQAFSRWRQRLGDQAKWIEACRRSTIYKERARAERLSRSVGSSPSANGFIHQKAPFDTPRPLQKRLRERFSGEYRPPANDDELAKRFEKNHEDHARRWARGSFLVVLRNFLKSARSPMPDNWCAWLSLNQESDGTAIWLEQKFNVPDSGKWKNENIFQIPISKDHVELSHSYPGVVIFERTPLTSVTDILGRKYRVLEDCTRLREIVEAFPADRHYVPPLLCITWSERDPDSSKDFDDMVKSMVEGGMLTSTHDLLISTTAMDMESNLDKLLHVIPFDLEGRLVKHVSLNDLFDIWEHRWEEMTTSWLGNCTVYGEFKWDVYAKLLEWCTRLLIQLIDSVTGLLRGVASNIPHLELDKDMDSETTFGAVLDWLQALPETDFTVSLMGDVTAHQNLGRDFPTMTFLSQLYALGRAVAAHVADVHAEDVHFVSRPWLDDVLKELDTLKVSFEEEMKAYHIAKIKNPLKRPASFTETRLDSSRASTPMSKKPRVSLSDSFVTDEETTSHSPSIPSPSTATSVPSEPVHTIVTPAMLRALTKDIRARYGPTIPNALSSSVSR